MNHALKPLLILCMAGVLNSCENTWVVFPKYPAPYSYLHPEKIKGSEIEINHVAVEAYLGVSRSIFDYESPTSISVRVACRDPDKKAVTGAARLEWVVIKIDGAIRYSQQFENVATGFGEEKKMEGVYCSGNNGVIKFSIVDLPPQVAYKEGQALTLHASVAVTNQALLREAKSHHNISPARRAA